MRSLKLRLFATLLVATSVVWLAAVAWIYVYNRREVEHVLDTRLQEAARMVTSLASGLDRTAAAGGDTSLPPIGNYERQLSCQVWSFDGRMIARSSGAPDARLAHDAAGFSDRLIDGEAWRVYTVVDDTRGIRVMVGDRVGLRERLLSDLIKGLVWPALLVAPVLGVLIWACLGQGLRPLRRMTRDLASRDAEDMRPVALTRAPAEVRPLADALNALFRKVEAARQHEREITAFAAHELRTPLAGLKTQAQVALATDDPGVVRAALQQIVAAVDRSGRLVRQLLTIARLDADLTRAACEPVAVGPLLAQIISDIPTSDRVTVTVEPSARELVLDTNAECLLLALRNLHENAVQHTADGSVTWRADKEGLLVEDDGQGIPADEIDKIGTRFFRGRYKSQIGSGLGLSIVKLALSKVGAELKIGNRSDRRGVRSLIAFGSGGSAVMSR